MDAFLAATITGLATAGIFAIAASGLVLTYTTTGIFNFAHGAVGMLAAFAYWQLLEFGLPTAVAAVLVVAVAAPLFGAFVERVVMRGLVDAPEASRLVVSVALLAVCLGLGLWIWPPDEARPLDVFFDGNFAEILGVRLSWHEVLSFVLAIVVAFALRFLLRSTRTGMTMRAVVDDRELASLNGTRPDQIAAVSWALGFSLAALAGVLLAPFQTLAHLPLTLLIVNAYAAAMIGRLKSLPLTFAGALLLGLLDSYAFNYRPEGGSFEVWFQNFRPAIPVVVLFVVLVTLPSARLRTGAGRRRLAAPRPTWSGALAVSGVLLSCAALLSVGLNEANSLRAAGIVAVGVVALSLVPLVGWAGQLCLCQMSFAALGAICVGQLGGGSEPWALLVGAAVAGVAGVLVALPAARLSGIELALATAAFAVILDRWIFRTPDVALGPFTVSTFDRDSLPVDRLSLPVLGTLGASTLLIVTTVAFVAIHLLLTGVRRSAFGDRLLAFRESPAACATLGIDPVVARLGVFCLSASVAGFGGGLYAGTQGAVTPSDFDFFQSLPLLLVTVAGGVATTGGAIFGALTLGALPVLAATSAVLAGLAGLVPGLMGIILGRNPDGVVATARFRLEELWPVRPITVAVAVLELVVAFGWLVGFLTGWWSLGVGLLIPFAVLRLTGGRAPEHSSALGHPLDDLEHRPLDGATVSALDDALSLADIPVRS